MTETTTIEITKKQKAELDSLKTHEDESYKSVIGRMLESPDLEGVEEVKAMVKENTQQTQRIATQLEGLR